MHNVDPDVVIAVPCLQPSIVALMLYESRHPYEKYSPSYRMVVHYGLSCWWWWGGEFLVLNLRKGISFLALFPSPRV